MPEAKLTKKQKDFIMQALEDESKLMKKERRNFANWKRVMNRFRDKFGEDDKITLNTLRWYYYRHKPDTNVKNKERLLDEILDDTLQSVLVPEEYTVMAMDKEGDVVYKSTVNTNSTNLCVALSQAGMKLNMNSRRNRVRQPSKNR